MSTLDLALPSQPVQFFVKLLEIWELDLDSACTLLGYEKSSRSHVQAVLSGAAPLETRDERDRIAELFVIRKRLHSVFRLRGLGLTCCAFGSSPKCWQAYENS